MGLFGALIVRPTAGRRLRATTARTASSPRPRSSWCCSRRSTPTSTRRSSRASNFNMNNYHPRYWLINGRGFPDSIADNGASWLPTPALRCAGRRQAVRRGDAPAPGHGPLPQRRHRGLPLPPARQQRPGDRPRRPARWRGRPARTCRSRSSPSTSDPARPGTSCSSGTTPRATARTNPVPVTVPEPGEPGDRHRSTAAARTSGRRRDAAARASRPSTSAVSTTSSRTTTRCSRSPRGAPT